MAQFDAAHVFVFVGQFGQAAEQAGLGVGDVVAVGIFVVVAFYLLHIAERFKAIAAAEQGAGSGYCIAVRGVATMQKSSQIIAGSKHVSDVDGFILQRAAQCAGTIVGSGDTGRGADRFQ